MRLFLLGLISLFCAAAVALAFILHVEPPTCSGVDLLTTLKEEEPDRHAELRERTSKIPNAEGRLWRIERLGSPPSLLFGTIHRSDPRAMDLPLPLRDALAKARVVLVEITTADSEAFQETLTSEPSLMMAGEGPFFDDAFTEAQKAIAADVLDGYGMSYEGARQLKPAMVLNILGFSPCVIARTQAGLPTVDDKVQQLGRDAGAKVIALEDALEQWSSFERASSADINDMLLSSFVFAEKADDFHETMLLAYLREELMLYWEYSIQATADAEFMVNLDAAIETYWEKLIANRNKTMAESAEPHLVDGGVIMAVGALHLAGEDGLIELLRARGFAVTRVE